MASAQPQVSASSRRSGMFVALAPWFLFTIVVRLSTFEAGSLVALVAAAVIAAPGVAGGRPKVLELGAVATFAAFTAVSFQVDSSTAHDIALYARGIAAAALAVIALGSLLFTPFTEQYARESVPEAFWGTAEFKAANRRLTAMWGAIFAAMVPFHVIAGQIDTTRGNIVFNWAIPIVLVLWGLKRSEAEAGGELATA